MSPSQNILLLGATGYIGGTVLEKLLQHPLAADFKISTPVRDPVKAEKLKAFGVTPVVADFQYDLDMLKTLAKDADVVFSIADSSNLPAAKAVLAGTKTRFELTGRQTIYIHTSGAGAIADCTVLGMHGNGPTWDDLDEVQMASIGPTQLHRAVDLEIFSADDEGYIKSYIIIPTTIYGVAIGPLVESGIQKPQTTVLPPLIAASLDRGQAGMVGDGKNVWQNVELRDVADLYIVLYDAIITDTMTAHGRSGLYFAENGTHELVQVGEIIARTLFEHGRGKSPKPTSFTTEEGVKYFGPLAPLIGSNAKCSANRARALGWKPTKTTSDFLACVLDVATSYASAGKDV
ncbi:NAD-binding protein [Mycena albidolilacea]|uniref:NAD-binding protein n=1 Tax=Mycena albidolilacea TaxID=1033008 RepID=A0AAD7EKY8_9AGAR|nr:NAD-binding protein [Mycena albidolilacea]